LLKLEVDPGWEPARKLPECRLYRFSGFIARAE